MISWPKLRALLGVNRISMPSADVALAVTGYERGTITPLGSTDPAGNLDGVEANPAGGYFATDWMSGGLLKVSPDGKAETILDLDQGSADLEVIPDQNLVVIPMMMNGSVAAYKVE